MMELGYALSRSRRVVISAKKTQLPFDQDKLATYFWDEGASHDGRRKEYGDWFHRQRASPIVEPKRL